MRDGVVVIKRDGRREDFDREKLVRATRAACHKRPVDAEQIALYRKFGFAISGRRANYYQNPDESALLLSLKIQA